MIRSFPRCAFIYFQSLQKRWPVQQTLQRSTNICTVNSADLVTQILSLHLPTTGGPPWPSTKSTDQPSNAWATPHIFHLGLDERGRVGLTEQVRCSIAQRPGVLLLCVKPLKNCFKPQHLNERCLCISVLAVKGAEWAVFSIWIHLFSFTHNVPLHLHCAKQLWCFQHSLWKRRLQPKATTCGNSF